MRISSPVGVHVAAFLGVVTLHLLLASWMMWPKHVRGTQHKQAIAQSQLIRISLVAQKTPLEKHIEQQPKQSKQLRVQNQPQPMASLKAQGRVKQTINSKLEPESKTERTGETIETIETIEQHELQTPQLTSDLISDDLSFIPSSQAESQAVSYLNNPAPHYPEKARLRRQQGTVLLHVQVNFEGKPKAIDVIKSSGYHLLDQAALKAVKQWAFIPAQQESKPVEQQVEIPITFRMDENNDEFN